LKREPSLKISRDEISAVYTDGEAAVISLVESLVAINRGISVILLLSS
jgi:hypothetical protein